MKKRLSIIGLIIFAIYMFLTITYAVSEKPKEDAIKTANDLLHENIEHITSN